MADEKRPYELTGDAEEAGTENKQVEEANKIPPPKYNEDPHYEPKDIADYDPQRLPS